MENTAYIAKAEAKYVRISPQKCRLVMDLIRGKDVGEALTILHFLKRRKASNLVAYVLNSAIANAQQKFPSIDVDSLYISNCLVNQGPSLKRIRPAPMGRAYRILKRTSHISIYLNEKIKRR